jgi:hypothetical protein
MNGYAANGHAASNGGSSSPATNDDGPTVYMGESSQVGRVPGYFYWLGELLLHAIREILCNGNYAGKSHIATENLIQELAVARRNLGANIRAIER